MHLELQCLDSESLADACDVDSKSEDSGSAVARAPWAPRPAVHTPSAVTSASGRGELDVDHIPEGLTAFAPTLGSDDLSSLGSQQSADDKSYDSSSDSREERSNVLEALDAESQSWEASGMLEEEQHTGMSGLGGAEGLRILDLRKLDLTAANQDTAGYHLQFPSRSTLTDTTGTRRSNASNGPGQLKRHRSLVVKVLMDTGRRGELQNVAVQFGAWVTVEHRTWFESFFILRRLVIILGATFINSQRVKTVYFVAAAVTFVAMDILFKPYQMWQSKVLAFVCWTSIILLTSLGAASSGATSQMGLSDGGDAMEITICMVPVVVTGGFFLYRAWLHVTGLLARRAQLRRKELVRRANVKAAVAKRRLGISAPIQVAQPDTTSGRTPSTQPI